MQNDRRTFLKNVGGVTAAVVAGSALTRETTGEVQSPDSGASLRQGAALQRPPGRVQIGLFLAGEKGEKGFAGWLSSVEGGSAEAEVVTEKLGPDNIARKHIAGVKYEDITINCGTGMSKAFYEWIKASFDGKPSRRDGAIVAADFNNAIVDTLTFQQALISEIAFPALDASSKEAAKMTVKLAPEMARFDLGDGTKVDLPPIPQGKRWLTSNFKVGIDGLDDATTRISKVDAIVIKQSVADDPATGAQLPGPLDVPDLAITFPEADAAGFLKWHEEILATNNADSPDAAEKAGWIKYYPPNFSDPFFTLSFSNLGLSKVTPPASASGDNLRHLKAGLYSETIKFEYKAT